MGERTDTVRLSEPRATLGLGQPTAAAASLG